MSAPTGLSGLLGARRRQLPSQRGMTLVEVLIALSISVMLIAPLFSWAIVAMGQQRATAERNGETAGMAFLTTRLEEDAANAVEVQPPETLPAQLCQSATGETVHLVLLRPDPDAPPGDPAERQVVYSTADDNDPGPKVLRRHECDAADGTDSGGADLVEGLTDVTGSCPVPADAGRRPPCWTVKLALDPAKGADTSIEATRRIDSDDALPRARFVHDPLVVYRGEEVEFSAAGSWDPHDLPLSSYVWNFGEGAPGSGVDESHTFTEARTYTVTLTVSNGERIGSASRQIVVLPARPKITEPLTVEPTPTHRNELLTFSARIERGDSASVTCTWTWGDGTTTGPDECNGNVSATHRFGQPPAGRDQALTPRQVELVVTGTTGEARSRLVVAPENERPTLAIGAVPSPAIRRGDSISPTFTASSPYGSIWKIEIDWGDGNTQTVDCNLVTPCSQPITHIYTARGDFTIRATAYDDIGDQSAEATRPIDVRAKAPTGEFTPGNPNANTPQKLATPTTFSPVPVDDAQDVATWAWTLTSWPDQVSVRSSAVRTPSWTGVTPGKYQLTLTVTGHDDGPRTVTKYVLFTGTPAAPGNVQRVGSGGSGGGTWADISFDAVPGATAYQVDLNRRGPCGDGNRVWNAAGVAEGGRYEVRATVPNLCLGQSYRVRVRASVDGTWGNWTTIRVPL